MLIGLPTGHNFPCRKQRNNTAKKAKEFRGTVFPGQYPPLTLEKKWKLYSNNSNTAEKYWEVGFGILNTYYRLQATQYNIGRPADEKSPTV